LKRQAKRSLNFVNYKPIDGSLGSQKHEGLQEVKDNEILLRMDKMIRAFYGDTKEAIKIIPKKSTLDLEQKLKQKFDRLKLRTEMGIVSILKDKILAEKRGNPDEDNQENGMNGQELSNHRNGNQVEEEMIARLKRMQAIEDNPKIKEVAKCLIVG
jgi:hypothetical protein